MRRKLGDSGRLFRLAGGFAPPPGPAEGKIGGLLADDVNVVGERTDPGDSGCEDEDRKRIKYRCKSLFKRGTVERLQIKMKWINHHC